MMDLFDDDTGDTGPGDNAPEFSVSELSGAVKRVIEGEFAHVRVRGEIGRVSRPRSGHVYLDLKDDRAVISGVIWKGRAVQMDTVPEEGLEVIATGKLTTFPGQSKYQIIIEDIRPAGMGALMAMLEKRKKLLEAEGLFAPERKTPLPYLPEIIGVVTSPSGAVIRDILHRLRDRFPRKVLIWPVAVHSASNNPEVVRAIRGCNAVPPGGALPRPDLLIVARGGGSIEDLWGFNEEDVARAAADSRIPLISAVGHETDTTLIDFVADRRAPTPTAAAEMAVPVRLDLLAWTREQDTRLSRAAGQGIERRRQRLSDLARVLPKPEALLNEPRQRLDRAEAALARALERMVEKKRAALAGLTGALRPASLRSRISTDRNRLTDRALRLRPGLQRGLTRRNDRLADLSARLRPGPLRDQMARDAQALARTGPRLKTVIGASLTSLSQRLDALDRTRRSLGYHATLARGYAVVRAGDTIVTEASAATGPLEIEFQDGRVKVLADRSPRKSPPKSKPKPDQGTLL